MTPAGVAVGGGAGTILIVIVALLSVRAARRRLSYEAWHTVHLLVYAVIVLGLIHQVCHGVPRRINLLCDRALLGGYATGQQRIGADVVEQAAAEVFGAAPATTGDWASSVRRAAPWAGGVLVGVSIAAASAFPAAACSAMMSSKLGPPRTVGSSD